MPDPSNYASESEFMADCVPMMEDEGKPHDVAVAACLDMWSNRSKAVPTMNRAYSILEIKEFNQEQRIIEGIATTPTPDRMGDIVSPMGAKFSLPMPLLWQHRHDQPVGHVVAAKPTKNGIPVRIRISKIEEQGELKRLVDKAWQSVKAELVRGLSIGFKPIKDGIEALDDGGLHFKKWDWLELSLVTIPANQEATIQTIKSIDSELRAASGRDEPSVDATQSGDTDAPVKTKRPGGSGRSSIALTKRSTGTMSKKTTAEMISAFEATRQAKAARMAEIMDEAAETGETLDEAQTDEYDGLEREVKAIDDHLKRLHALENANVAAAKPVEGSDVRSGAESRMGAVRVEVKHQLPKGTMFTRYVMAMAAARGAPLEALEYAKRWDGQTPEVSDYIRATAFNTKAEPGTTFGPTGSPLAGWGGALVQPTDLAAEFVELLRPATVVGRITGFRRVPFNVRIPVQTGGSTVNWVGEAAAKPTSELSFDTMLLTFSKIAGIVVLTDELVRLSSPSAEATVRQDLVRQVAQFMDAQFLDPNVTETTDRPASITNGVSPETASGTDAEAFYFDLNAALAAFDSTDLGTGNLWLVMPTALARGISTLRNPLGQFEFSNLGAGGGTIQGFQVLVSNSAPSGTIVLIKSDEIFLADDGGVTIDASNQATLDMAGGNTPTFNLWQKNCIGVRAERYIRWRKRRAEAVAMIDTAAYGPVAPGG